jgi:competence protein ComEC
VIRATLLETTSAQLLTLPIVLHAFGQYATYALIANVLVLPLVPMAMLLTFVAGTGGLALPHLAHWFGWPARLILLCNIWIIGKIAHWPGASGDISFGMPALMVCYAGLLGLAIYLWRVTDYNFREAEQDDSLAVF